MTVRLLPGIETVEADFKTRTARIRYDPEMVALTAILQALETVGYEARTQGRENPP